MPMEVLVLPYDPAWADMFHAESQLILSALGENSIAAHHIGSTAIPGVVAKPVIDMLIVVADIEAVDRCSENMEAIGYEVMGEFGIPSRRYFRKDNDTGKRTHHVHVFADGSNHIVRHLAFRDFMKAHPEWATRYSDLKLKLVAANPDSIERYMEGKDGFIKQVDQLAAE
ncbi:MAG: GrpB family protein [Planctomycetaceae bacterium]|nr:GrpB family protein [Planctomycetales bacterium]MCB9926442.1 GrpB family protein [Planctomycetaceae bacterium]